jgi:uncharacterized protein (DUF433 family)
MARFRLARPAQSDLTNILATMTPAQIVEELPDLEEEDIREALGYAAALAPDELHPLRS